jgi:hypothetical protein
MVPENWLSILFFLVLVAPGLWFDLLVERRQAAAPESIFREASRTVLASAMFSGVALAILVLVGVFRPHWMPQPAGLLFDQKNYLPEHYRIVLRTLLMQLVVSLILVHLAGWVKYRKSKAQLFVVSTWTRVFREETPKNCVPFVQVRLANEMTYLGEVGHFTANLDTSERELVLVPPLFVKTPGGKLVDMPKEWERIVLSGDTISSLIVQYRPQINPHSENEKSLKFRRFRASRSHDSETSKN